MLIVEMVKQLWELGMDVLVWKFYTTDFKHERVVIQFYVMIINHWTKLTATVDILDDNIVNDSWRERKEKFVLEGAGN